jgi:hypothetical protein
MRIDPYAIQQSLHGGLLEVVRQPDVESALRGTRVAPLPVEPLGLALPPPALPSLRLRMAARRTWADRLNEALQAPPMPPGR